MSNEALTLAALAAHQILVACEDEDYNDATVEAACMAAASKFGDDELAQVAAYEAVSALLVHPRLRVLEHFAPVFTTAMNAAAMHEGNATTLVQAAYDAASEECFMQVDALWGNAAAELQQDNAEALTPSTPDEVELLRGFRKLSDDKRSAMLAWLQDALLNG